MTKLIELGRASLETKGSITSGRATTPDSGAISKNVCPDFSPAKLCYNKGKDACSVACVE